MDSWILENSIYNIVQVGYGRKVKIKSGGAILSFDTHFCNFEI